MESMQTCLTGEVRGSKRKGLLKPPERLFWGEPAALGGGSQNPQGSALAAREGSALSSSVLPLVLPLLDNTDGFCRI